MGSKLSEQDSPRSHGRLNILGLAVASIQCQLSYQSSLYKERLLNSQLLYKLLAALEL